MSSDLTDNTKYIMLNLVFISIRETSKYLLMEKEVEREQIVWKTCYRKVGDA